jgi:hypothetical protein
MKTQTLIVAAALMMLAGCASQKQDSAAATAAPGSNDTQTVIDANGDGIPDAPTGTGNDPGTTGYSSGSTASVVLNGSALGRLFYNSNPVHPTNPRINIDLHSNTEAVVVSYVENGILHEAAFGSQHPNVTSYSNTMYNGWVGSAYKAFFQDAYGAIVLVLDKAMSQSDGTATMILGGSVYFQNFQQVYYQNPTQGPLKMCWEITAGPYDCRSFLVARSPSDPAYNQYNKLKVDMTSSAYPTTYGPNKTTAYERLGDFGGINRTAAGL